MKFDMGICLQKNSIATVSSGMQQFCSELFLLFVLNQESYDTHSKSSVSNNQENNMIIVQDK